MEVSEMYEEPGLRETIGVENIRKYFKDHPELADQKDAILEAALKASVKGVLSPGKKIQEVMGDLAESFFEEIVQNPDHVIIAAEAMKNASNM